MMTAAQETLATLANMPKSETGYVSLTTLRAELAHIERAEMDEALFGLLDAGQLRAIQNDNAAALRWQDNEAALDVNGCPRHLVRLP